MKIFIDTAPLAPGSPLAVYPLARGSHLALFIFRVIPAYKVYASLKPYITHKLRG